MISYERLCTEINHWHTLHGRSEAAESNVVVEQAAQPAETGEAEHYASSETDDATDHPDHSNPDVD